MIYNLAGTDSDLQSDVVAILGETKADILEKINPILKNGTVKTIALYGIDGQKNKTKHRPMKKLLDKHKKTPKH
jgi:hypothetical protein